jgi:hypothetical protein
MLCLGSIIGDMCTKERSEQARVSTSYVLPLTLQVHQYLGIYILVVIQYSQSLGMKHTKQE